MTSLVNGAALKEWSSAIGRVGIPGAIAVFLVYIGAKEIPKLVLAVEATAIEVRLMREAIREHTAQNDELIRLIRRTCRNAARDEISRNSCDDK